MSSSLTARAMLLLACLSAAQEPPPQAPPNSPQSPPPPTPQAPQESCTCAASSSPDDLHYCRSTGDPHYQTFGNKQFDFMGTGVYQLVQTNTECSVHSAGRAAAVRLP